jgi:hypothetical protein
MKTTINYWLVRENLSDPYDEVHTFVLSIDSPIIPRAGEFVRLYINEKSAEVGYVKEVIYQVYDASSAGGPCTLVTVYLQPHKPSQPAEPVCLLKRCLE